jgi:hypothetical protein
LIGGGVSLRVFRSVTGKRQRNLTPRIRWAWETDRSKKMAGKIDVQGKTITIISQNEEDYISLTDMVKDIENGLALIEKWLRNKNTIEFLGIWEEMYNQDFNSPEFEGIKNQAGFNRFVLSVKQWVEKTHSRGIVAKAGRYVGKTAKQWRDENADLKGNIRDYADISQLVCLSNLENLNAHFIQENIPQAVRLQKLNTIAIHQMILLTTDNAVKRIENTGDKK